MYSVDDLYAFAALIETGSVTSAANHLQLNPATVSRRLTKLENHLGVPLFLRNTRSFSVTAEGQDFYTNVAEAIALLRDAESNLLGQGNIPSGKLRIALPSWLMITLLQPHLGAFLETYPDLQLDVLTTDEPISLVSEGRDIGIRVGELGDSSLKARLLYNDNIVLCASPAYLSAKGTPRSLSDLIEHVLINHGNCCELLDSGQQIGQRALWQSQHKVSTSCEARLMALSNLGVAPLFSSQVQKDLESGALVTVLTDVVPSPRVPVWFVRTDGRIGTPKVDAFRNFMLEYCISDTVALV